MFRPSLMTYFGGLAAAAVLVGMVGLIILSLRPGVETATDSEPTVLPDDTPVVSQGGSLTPTPEPTPTPTPEQVAASETPSPTPTPTPTPDPVPVADPETLQQIEESLAQLPGLASSSVILPDGSEVMYSAARQVPAASLIKMWIAAATYDEAHAGGLDLASEHVVQASEQAPGTGILNGADYVGRQISYAEVVEIMLVHSDNTAANILIDRIGGMERVNQYAAEHGYDDTRLQRRLGQLDPERENYTSAEDCARFLQRVLEGEVVNDAASDAIRDALLRRRTNGSAHMNFFGRELAAGVEYAHISGLLPAARNEAGFFLTPDGYPVIVVILLDTLPSVSAGETAIARMIGDIYDRVT